MRRAAVIGFVLLIGLGIVAGAGEEGIKWSTSKKLAYIPADIDPASFSAEAVDYPDAWDKYRVSWAPYTSNDIDFVDANYDAWELRCIRLNWLLKQMLIKETDYPTAVASERSDFERNVVFYVTFCLKGKDFCARADETYWRFYMPSAAGPVDPVDVYLLTGFPHTFENQYVDSTPSQFRLYSLAGSRTIERTFRIRFAQPPDLKPGAPVKLVIEGGDVKHGFEWRFKEE